MRRSATIALSLLAISGTALAAAAPTTASASQPSGASTRATCAPGYWSAWQTYKTVTLSNYTLLYQRSYWYPQGIAPSCNTHATQVQYRTVKAYF
jgi:hypothetical protein